MPISILLVRQSLQSSNMNQHGIIIRVATILICSSFAIGLLIFLLYPQFYIRLFLLGTVWANFSAETTPGVYVMPVQMSVSTKAQVERIGFGIDEGTRLSFLKYEVRVPWKGIDKEIIKDSTACFQFVSHRAVCFSENVDLKKAMMGKLSEKDRVILRNVFGQESFISNYSLMDAILNTNPAQLSLFTPHKEVVRTSIFTVLKSILVLYADDKVFSFRHNNLNGILIMSPSKRGYAHIHIFDNQNKGIEISVIAQKESVTSLSQGEIEQIIQTVHTKD